MEEEKIAEVGRQSLGEGDCISSLPEDLRAAMISLLLDSIAGRNLGIRYLYLSRLDPLKQKQPGILRKRGVGEGGNKYDQLQHDHDHVHHNHDSLSSWSLFSKFLEVLELTNCNLCLQQGYLSRAVAISRSSS